MSARKIIKSFFESEFFGNKEIMDSYFHDDLKIFWHSSSGYTEMDKPKFIETMMEMSKSFNTLRCDISHLLRDGDTVSVRYTYHFTSIENPNEEFPMAHFIGIYEVKDEKIYKIYQMSQPAGYSLESLK